MNVLHVFLAFPHDSSDASRDRRVVDLVRADVAEGVSVQLITNAPFGALSGVALSPVDASRMPGGQGEVAEFARLSLVAFATALESRPDRVDLVVAHGWASLHVATRLACRSGSRLVLIGDDETSPEGGVVAKLACGQLESARESGVEIVDSRTLLQEGGAFDVGVGGGAPWELAERVLTRSPRTVVVKGLSREEQARALAGAAVVLFPRGAPEAAQTAHDALAGGSLPVLVGAPGASEPEREVLPSVGDARGLDAILAECLSDRFARAARVRRARERLKRAGDRESCSSARPLRIVLNHGGLVARELADSVGPLGWEVRSLAGDGGDPLSEADFLVVLPYGDPKGALAAVRRAKALGVPSVFWNVEDPRYFFDPELGPLVRDMARESSAVFSTTLQLEREYQELGVELRYLPVYGRGHFLAETTAQTRPIDVLFLGTLTPERRALLDELRACLPGVALVARDDVREPRSLMDLVSSAKLGLSCGTLTDAVTPTGLLRSEGVTERVFDYPLAGTPVLSDERAHLRDLLVEGEEVFVFKDASDAAQQIRALLADPVRRARVAGQARERVLAQHLGRHRMLTVADTLIARGLLGAEWREAVSRARERSEALNAREATTLVSVGS